MSTISLETAEDFEEAFRELLNKAKAKNFNVLHSTLNDKGDQRYIELYADNIQVNDQFIWLIGTVSSSDNLNWQIEGIYELEADAVDNCKENEFIVKCKKNGRLPENVKDALKLYWPKHPDSIIICNDNAVDEQAIANFKYVFSAIFERQRQFDLRLDNPYITKDDSYNIPTIISCCLQEYRRISNYELMLILRSVISLLNTLNISVDDIIKYHTDYSHYDAELLRTIKSINTDHPTYCDYSTYKSIVDVSKLLEQSDVIYESNHHIRLLFIYVLKLIDANNLSFDQLLNEYDIMINKYDKSVNLSHVSK